MQNQKLKALVDTGNNIREGVAISEKLHEALNVGFRIRNEKLIGTASAGSKMTKLGTSNPVKLKFEGIRREFTVTPTVIRELVDHVNIGDRFMSNVSQNEQINVRIEYTSSGKKLKLGDEEVEMIQVMAEEEPKRGRMRGRTPACQREMSVPERNAKLYNVKDEVIKKNSVKFIEAKTERPVSGNETILIEGKDTTYCDVPTAVYENVKKIAVINTGQEDITIKKDTHIGYYSLFKEAEIKERINNVEENKAEETPLELQEKALRDLGIYENPILKANKQIQDKVVAMIRRYYKIFGEPQKSIGKTDLIEFSIELKEKATPVRQKLRPLNPDQLDSLKKQLKEWEENDVIEPSKSPWASPLVPAWKKGNKIRWAIDYRCLNEVTVGDSFPVPNIETNLEKLAGSRVYSALDAASAYNTIPVSEKTRPLLAFITPFGLYTFKRMPFGAKNAGNVYSRFVEMLLSRLNSSNTIGYLDDILIFTRSLEQHVEELEAVLKLHEIAGIKLRAAKTKLFTQDAEYLGFVVSEKGIQMNHEYVDKILNWPAPITVKELNTFLGYTGYYRTFIKDFSNLTYEMNQQRRAKKLEWTPVMEEKFNKLKEAFGKRPIRSYPRYDIPAKFQVTTDFSATAIGAVLSQVQDGQERFLGACARKTTAHEANYGSCKGELAAVVYAFRKWEHILRYRPFILNTDAQSLKFLKTMNNPKGIFFRWLTELADYNFEVIHRSGKSNKNADALSRATFHEDPSKEEEDEYKQFMRAMRELHEDDAIRKLKEIEAADEEIRRISQVGADLSKEALAEKQKLDPVLSQVRGWVEAGAKPSKNSLKGQEEELKMYAQIFEALTIENDLLYYTSKLNFMGNAETKRLVVPTTYATTVFYWSHEHETAGHFGISATIQRARRRFYYPGMTTELRRMVASCKACVAKITKVNLKKGTHVPQRSGYPLETINIDLVGPLPTTVQQYKYILTVEDSFTRYVQAYPLRNKEGATVARVLLDEFICRYGMPQRIHSDNGKEFTNSILNELTDRLNIDKTTTPTYNPQSNPVERFHRTLNQTMRVFMEREEIYWDRYLPAFLMAYNSKVNSASGVTPYYAFYGRELRLPIDLVLPAPEKENVNEHVKTMIKRMQNVYQYIRKNNEAVIRRNASGYLGEKFAFKVNDKVLYLSPRKLHSKPLKLTDQWIGPYRIVKRISEVLYRIKPADYEGPTIAVHAARLISASQRNLGNKVQVPRNLDLDDDGDELGEEIRLPRDSTNLELGAPVQIQWPDNEIIDLRNRNTAQIPAQQQEGSTNPTQQQRQSTDKSTNPAQQNDVNATEQVFDNNDYEMNPGVSASPDRSRHEPDPIEEPMSPAASRHEPDDQMTSSMESMPPLIPKAPSSTGTKRKRNTRRTYNEKANWDSIVYGTSGSEAENQEERKRRSTRRGLMKTLESMMTDEENMQEIKSIEVEIDKESTIPTKGTQGSAAVDLYSNTRVKLEPGATVAVPLKLRIAIPESYCMVIMSRSGLALRGITVQGGLIDSDYRGEICAILHNNSSSAVQLEKGQRVAQGLFIKIENVQFNEKEKLSETTRNTGGLGHTGL